MYAEELVTRPQPKQTTQARMQAEIDELSSQVAFLMECNKNTRAVASGMQAVILRTYAAALELMDHMAVSDADDRTRLLVENLRRALNAE